jgi:hypothetical protein
MNPGNIPGSSEMISQFGDAKYVLGDKSYAMDKQGLTRWLEVQEATPAPVRWSQSVVSPSEK